MSLRFLLDTNVVSEPLRPRPRQSIVRRLQQHQNEMAIPSIVWHELLFGAERLPRSRRRDAIEFYLEDVVRASVPILDYDAAAAEWHARERARLVSRGETPSFVDGQIAAIARTRELSLVTFHAGDFKRFEGLRVVTWS